MKEKDMMKQPTGPRHYPIFFGLLLFSAAGCLMYGCKQQKKEEKSFVNALGMKMIYVPAGSFQMGATKDSLHLEKFTDMSKDAPSWDEKPAHRVTISRGFYMEETEVTVSQFRQFEKDYQGTGYFTPSATGISWNEAHAFCQWLGKKTGKPYRLPTEAEWEYACRAGTTTPFWSGDRPPRNDLNPWGLKGMESGAPEWCHDWLGPYPDSAVRDPVGYNHGWGKVVRGGALDTRDGKDDTFSPDTAVVFYRAANRGSLPPGYPQPHWQGTRPHFIGFRVVMGALPATKPLHFNLGMAF
ncbi:MAG TPA: formylglycine-generating enzyme family protein, partial [Chitinophagaceae bacterium]|nr:formylglycine-generating enzyme family protein [Chitinophagaceae bacterium]